jgi:cardiolipin synthase
MTLRHRILSSLRPSAFRKLPRELRARRIGVLARRLPDGLRDPEFAELLERVDGGPFSSGSRVRPFFDGAEAVDSMLAAIASARQEVLVEAYIFTDDSTGHRYLDALGEAAARGVRTAVLADAFGSLGTDDEFWREMRRRGVEVRLFHPLLSAFLRYQFRDHRKILAVDRRIAFLGGMNIADEYAWSRRRHGRDPEAMRDTHLRVEGPVAAELAAVFAEGWQRADGEPVPASLPGAPGSGGTRPDEESAGVPLLVLDSRPGRGSQETASILTAVLTAARRSVWLTVGYFAPGRRVVSLLGTAAARGCDVRLLLPGPTDLPVVRHAGHAAFGRLLAHGVPIWEYQSAVLHAKTLVADGYLSIIGSANLDVRSLRLNAECGLVGLDDRLAEKLTEAFLRDLEVSREIDLAAWRRRGLGHRIGDRLAGWLTPLL